MPTIITTIPPGRTATVRRPHGSANALVFRVNLGAHQETATEYEQLKRDLAARFQKDITASSSPKPATGRSV